MMGGFRAHLLQPIPLPQESAPQPPFLGGLSLNASRNGELSSFLDSLSLLGQLELPENDASLWRGWFLCGFTHRVLSSQLCVFSMTPICV